MNAVYWYILLHACLVCDSQTTRRNLKGISGAGYSVDIEIGTPPQQLSVLVDTGSSNFAIASKPEPEIDKYFVSKNSTTHHSLGRSVSVPYTEGSWEGELGQDVVRVPSVEASAVEIDISLIGKTKNFYIRGARWQGILGLGYRAISQPDSSVLSWFDVYSNETVTDSFNLQLCGSLPNDTGNNHDGVFHLGPPDTNLFRGRIYETRIVREWFYEILLTGISVNGSDLDVPCSDLNADKTIVDSGTTNLRLARKAYSAVVEKLKSLIPRVEVLPSFWDSKDNRCWHKEPPWHMFPDIAVSVASSRNTQFTIHLPPEAYIRRVNNTTGCYSFAVDASDTGTVLGVSLMEGLYVIFNRTSKTIGFAESTCGPSIKLSGPKNTTFDTHSCAYIIPPESVGALTIIAFILAGLLCIGGVIFVAYLSCWLWEKLISRRRNQHQGTDRESLASDDEDEGEYDDEPVFGNLDLKMCASNE